MQGTFKELAACLTGASYRQDKTFQGVSNDSRTLQPGNLYMALKGPRFDGHIYCQDALESGAAGLVVDHFVPECAQVPQLVVPDSYQALLDMGRWARKKIKARHVIGITGSSGKTTTKSMMQEALQTKGAVYASQKSFNNHIGVPLTLLNAPCTSDFLVAELGMNHKGEISLLSRIAEPTIAVITNIGTAHIGNLGSQENIARAKAEIFEGMQEGASVVLNADTPFFSLLQEHARQKSLQIRTFALHTDADLRVIIHNSTPAGLSFHVEWEGQKKDFILPLWGEHYIANMACVASVYTLLGVSPFEAFETLQSWVPLTGRGQSFSCSWNMGKILVIDDTFNANPSSMEASLRMLTSLEVRGRKVVILGDMGELGTEAQHFHKQIADILKNMESAEVILCGPLMAGVYETLKDHTAVRWYATAQDIIEDLSIRIEAGDTLLIKGSHYMKMYDIVSALQKIEKRHVHVL